MGPVAFIINATDLRPLTPGNRLHKYADDTYLIVPASNKSSVMGELENIDRWATCNNLRLNKSKSLEMVVCRNKYVGELPIEIPNVTRVASLNILGVTVQRNLNMGEHVNNVVSTCGQNLYALKVLKAHGMKPEELSNVCRATLVAKLSYASQGWRGYASVADINRLQAVLSRAVRWGVYSAAMPTLEDIIDRADQTLFYNVLHNSSHVLHAMLPPIRRHEHNLRPRAHNRQLPVKTVNSLRNFLVRMLYIGSY
jgi:hypothetical protein